MKRFIAVLSGLLVLPAFAEIAPVYYDEIIEYTDEMMNESDTQNDKVVNEQEAKQQKPVVVQRNVAGRSISRVTSAASTASNTNSRANTSSRVVASSPRNAQQTQRGTVSRTTKKQTTPTRAAVVSRSRANTSRTAKTTTARNGTNNKPVTARVSANNTVISSLRTNTGTSSSRILTDSGDPLYISGTGSRVGIVGRRSAVALSGGNNTPVITSEDISDTTSKLTNLAELTDYCKAQYAQCMDNYCNVLDDNQGRCSCSANIKTYEKTEQSLATITENFQDVVQKIKYIGLTQAQIEALFSETEAELAMKSNSDTSQLKNSLDAIKKKIVDVSSGSTVASLSDGIAFDLSGLLTTDFSSTTVFDLNSFLGNSKVSNQRGASLFNTATQRCKTAVLNSCVSQGIDSKVITNSYDLAIDKQCIEYERSLNEANAEMRNNVRNAQTILQQARLLLAQQRNAYDLRGCVAALDECMQDEYVCGDDYDLCLDPTGKYLANGEIVKGGTPGIAGGSVKNQQSITAETIEKWKSCGMYGLYSTWDYKDSANDDTCECTGTGTSLQCKFSGSNAWGGGTGENLNAYIDEKVEDWVKNYKSTKLSDNKDMATYLLNRVGWIDSKKDKVYGMCAQVLKQCQDYTFDSQGPNKNYKVDNEVIRQYLSLALTKIKLRQDSIISDYAETCWSDVYSCLATNSYDESNTNSTVSNTAVNACRSEIATCMSVTGYQPSDNTTLTLAAMSDWVRSKLLSCPANQYLAIGSSSSTSPATMGNVSCEPCPMLEKLSGITTISLDSTVSSGGQVSSCDCPSGYTKTTQGHDIVPHYTINNKKYYCVADGADICPYRLVTRLPSTSSGGAQWSDIFYILLNNNASVEEIDVTGNTHFDGYVTRDSKDYRLKVKTFYNTSTKTCDCPVISSISPVATQSQTTINDQPAADKVATLNDDTLDAYYGCSYRINAGDL